MARYINAEALEKRIDKELCKPCRDAKQDYNGVRCRACWVDDMLIWIDSELEVTADVREVVHGEWIYHHNEELGKDYRECSVCHCWFNWDMPRNSFCQNCGAKMYAEDFSQYMNPPE